MIRRTALHLVPVLIAAASQAGEITIARRPFTVEKSFAACVLPDEGCVLLQIEPDAWADYQIKTIAAHGSRVSKGDVLAAFDAEAIDEKLTDTRRAIEAATLNIAQAEHDLKILAETNPHELDALRRAAETAREEHSYFTKTRRKAAEESAAQELERHKQMLSNQQEELKQLSKMYAADDLTEETEEIILTRQKDDVAAAEFALRMETLNYQRNVEINLPREAITLANAERDTAIALRKAEQDLPRAVTLRKLELESLKTTLRRENENLAKLQHDRGLFEIKAAADGTFFHGPIENGRWLPGDAAKTLIEHGRPAVNKPFATLVPATAKLTLTAFVDEATARSLKADLTGIANLAGAEQTEIAVKVQRINTIPEPDGTYRADLAAFWPKDLRPSIGATARIRTVTYHQPAAIFIPAKALAFGPAGWTAEVKLADGKTERRPVKRGHVSNDDTEILSGLEPGQVIITPEK